MVGLVVAISLVASAWLAFATVQPANGNYPGPDTPTPTATASSATVAPGGSLTLAGANWKGSTSLGLTLFSDPVNLGNVTTASGGTFTTTVTIPASTALGAHTIEVSGLDAGDQTATVSVALTVVSATTSTTVPATTSTTKASGTPTTAASGGSLPRTGGETLPLLLVGLVLVGGGVALVVRRYRTI